MADALKQEHSQQQIHIAFSGQPIQAPMAKPWAGTLAEGNIPARPLPCSLPESRR
ncbi:MAG: hypothetical protein J7M29_03165 [Verrucomicrobia bacterium]|nr:hypothetical protein [Verrucomicrobiota bacterium]